MKTLQQWFSEYAQSHQHPTNILIHKVAVPTIYATVLALLWCIPFPQLGLPSYLNWSTLVFALGSAFYLRLSVKLYVGIALQSLIIFIGLFYLSTQQVSLLIPTLIIFAVAWVFQFIGHKIEGKKPSFLQDLQFLLIGPLWTLSFFYRRIGIKY